MVVNQSLYPLCHLPAHWAENVNISKLHNYNLLINSHAVPGVGTLIFTPNPNSIASAELLLSPEINS